MNNEQVILDTLNNIQEHVMIMNREMGEVMADVATLKKFMWLIAGTLSALIIEMAWRNGISKKKS